MFFKHNRVQYLDLDKQKWVTSVSYLIRDRFRTTNFAEYPELEDPSPYSIGKGDEDWRITYFNIQPSHTITPLFQSFLLMKHIDFSKFDAFVEAKDLKCPIPHTRGIKVKDSRNFQFFQFILTFKGKTPVFASIVERITELYKLLLI